MRVWQNYDEQHALRLTGVRGEALLDHALVAPDLLLTQCADVLWKKVRRGELSKDDIAAQTLEQADITIASTRGHLTPAIESGRIGPSRL